MKILQPTCKSTTAPGSESCAHLALDVDGPLFLQGDLDDATLIHSQVDGIPVAWSSNLTTILTASSAWGRRASYKVAPLLGLPTGLPYIRFKSNRELRPGDSYKLRPLANWLTDLPAAIVDDEVGQDVKEWARTRPAPTLLVEVDPRRGLQPHHLQELLMFSERVRLPKVYAGLPASIYSVCATLRSM